MVISLPLLCLLLLFSSRVHHVSVSQISAIVINITLDGQNYLEWAFTVETALRGHGLYFHLTDDLPTLKSAVKTWEINMGK